jgi:hypothetical protein
MVQWLADGGLEAAVPRIELYPELAAAAAAAESRRRSSSPIHGRRRGPNPPREKGPA